MGSKIAWLDASSDEQRQMRDIIRLFEDRDSRDELGLSQIRDGLSEALFPGTSTLLTRARYLLLVPWAFQEAAKKRDPMRAIDDIERGMISAIKRTDDNAGLFGGVAGAAVRNLPSSIYWSMLRQYGILADPSVRREDALGMVDINAFTPVAAAWAALPAPPSRFPSEVRGGFTLTREETEWIQQRLIVGGEGTLIAHFALHPTSPDSVAPWEDPAALTAPADVAETLGHARGFSTMIHGAQLLYNLMLAEEYEAARFDRVAAPVDQYRGELVAWAERCSRSLDARSWRPDGAIHIAERVRARPVHPFTRAFVEQWTSTMNTDGPQGAAANPRMRELVRRRERQAKGPQARLGNPRRLEAWGGGSGAGAIAYRWAAVRRVLADVHDGLARDAVLNA